MGDMCVTVHSRQLPSFELNARCPRGSDPEKMTQARSMSPGKTISFRSSVESPEHPCGTSDECFADVGDDHDRP
jgi:hypothetical protein